MKSKLRYLLWVFMLPAILIPWLVTQRASAEPDETHYTYLPLILKNYPPPPTGVYPQPWVENVSLGGDEDSTEIEIAPGESFTLRVEVSNRSSVHPGFLNEIVIGFPHYTSPRPPVRIVAHDLEGAVVQSNGSYQQVMATTLTWNPGEQYFVEINVGPLREPGTFPIYIKGVMSSIDGLTYRHISPVDGKPSAVDAYGELSQLYTINVNYAGVGIGRLNYYRNLAGVPEAAELPYWSQGCVSHAYYMVMNGVLTHAEDTANPYYSYAGYAAGQSSNLAGFGVIGIGQQDGWPVDVMMQSVFHAIPMLDPRLTLAGYGHSTNEDGSVPFAACLDVYRGLDYGLQPTYPVFWPPADGVTPLVAYAGGETPDPLTHCGYSAPSGAPIFLILGDGTGEQVLSTHSLKRDGVDIPHCAFDYETYTNPTPPHQQDGRDVLDYYDALVIMPRDPLAQGSTYTASMTADGQTYTWDFQVAPGFVDAPESQVLAPGRDMR